MLVTPATLHTPMNVATLRCSGRRERGRLLWPASPAGSPHASDQPFGGLRSTPGDVRSSCTEERRPTGS